MTTYTKTRSISPSCTVTARWCLAALTLTFKAKCAACHGSDGTGDPPVGKKFKLRHLRSADLQSGSDAVLSAVIRRKRSNHHGTE